jgi:hypothetical protein
MMLRRLRTLAGIALAFAACLAGPVRGEVKAASPDAFQLLFAERVAAPPAAVYQAIGQIGRWWSGEHTYSGDAANLSFALQAGACFCERWQDNAVEHGRGHADARPGGRRFPSGRCRTRRSTACSRSC